MGGRTPWSLRRYFVSIAVIALHLVFVGALITASRTQKASPRAADVVTALIALPTGLLDRTQRASPNGSFPRMTAPSRSLAPAIPALIFSTPAEIPMSIDWLGSAKQAAANIVSRQPKRQFGGIPIRADHGVQNGSSTARRPEHHAGEEYRLDTGERLVWISASCFFVPNPLTPGPPGEVVPGMHMLGFSGLHCPGNASPPEGELFKDLPQYKRYASK